MVLVVFRLVTLLQNQKATQASQQAAPPSRHNATTSENSTGVMINSANQVPTTRQLTTTTPLILNLSQLQGSNGLIILSSQTAAPISIINNAASAVVEGITTNSQTLTNAHDLSQSEVMDQFSQAGTSGASSQTSQIVNSHMTSPQLQDHLAGQIQNKGRLATHISNGQIGSAQAEAAQATITITPIKHENGDVELNKNFTQPQKTVAQASVSNVGSAVRSCRNQGQTNTVVLPSTGSDSKMDISGVDMMQHSSYSDNSPNKTPTIDDMVSELNMKNEIQTYDDTNLHMTHEEIQKTLCANLPPGARMAQGQLTNQNTGSLESMETMRTSMVSPQSADLNFDAFDILDLPDFDSDHLIGTSPATNVTTVMTSSSPNVTTTSSSSTIGCANCLSNSRHQSQPTKQDSSAGIANITDFSPDWSYVEGGVKILVTGPWYSTTSPYTVLFDSITVPATLVQSGVLRCFCPGMHQAIFIWNQYNTH